MAISYEAAAEVAKNLLGAVEAISAEQAKLAAVAPRRPRSRLRPTR